MPYFTAFGPRPAADSSTETNRKWEIPLQPETSGLSIPRSHHTHINI